MKLITLLLFNIFAFSYIIAQPTQSLESLYCKQILDKEQLLNGREYKVYFNPMYSNPMYKSMSEYNAIITMNGRIIKNVKIQYDLYLDELIYRVNERNNKNVLMQIMLNKLQVDSFVLIDNNAEEYFRKMSFDHPVNQHIDSGYYQILFEGKTALIVKHKAILKKENSRDIYEYKTDKYILVDNTWMLVNSKRKLLKAMGKNAKKVSKFIRKNNLMIRRASIQQIVELCMFYNSLL